MHVQKMKNNTIKTIRKLQVSNGCFMLSNIVGLFGLIKLILGFYPLFTPFFPPTRVKRGKKVPEVFPPNPVCYR